MRLGCEWRYGRKQWAENWGNFLKRLLVEIWSWMRRVQLVAYGMRRAFFGSYQKNRTQPSRLVLCYIIAEWFFFILSFFVGYILSFGLVRLRTIRLSARVGAHIERWCSHSCREDVTITDVIMKIYPSFSTISFLTCKSCQETTHY